MTMQTPALAMARRLALEQAWEAYRHGSFPVGAVILDPHGEVVAVGRNRVGEADAPEGRLRSSAIAHAEMDVLAQMPPGDYGAHTLVTSLEPCLLCRSAATLSTLGNVDFIASDLLWQGLDALPTLNSQVARRYPKMVGPQLGKDADFASVLPLAVAIASGMKGTTAGDYATRSPRAFAMAKHVVDTDAWPSREATLDDAMNHIADIADIAGSVSRLDDKS